MDDAPQSPPVGQPPGQGQQSSQVHDPPLHPQSSQQQQGQSHPSASGAVGAAPPTRAAAPRPNAEPRSAAAPRTNLRRFDMVCLQIARMERAELRLIKHDENTSDVGHAGERAQRQRGGPPTR